MGNTLQRAAFMSLSVSLTCFAYAQPVPNTATPAVDYVNMKFQGRYRPAPKTHYAKSSNGQLLRTETFQDLQALAKTLPPDARMRTRYAGQIASATRFPEELRNVSVVGYLHAVKLENGIDAHGNQEELCFQVMLGTSPKHGQGQFFGARVSGLPPDGNDIATFSAARRQLIQLLMYVAKVPERKFHSDFAEINPPLRVKVTGSLFFDGQNEAAKAGPEYARAASAWEIHPVMAIDQQ